MIEQYQEHARELEKQAIMLAQKEAMEQAEEKRQEKEETGERRDQYRKRFNQSRFIYSGDRCSMLVDPYICWTAYRGERRLHE